MLFDLSQNFDLNADLKMGSRSITIKYFETILSDPFYSDSFNTINLLFHSLEEEINQQQENIKVSLNDFNTKLIMKLMTVFLDFNNEQINMYNLNYEEFILILLKMVSKIAKNSTYEKIFVILDIPILTNDMYSFITQELKYCNLLIFTNNYQCIINSEDTFIYSKKPIDLANEEQIYTIFCEEYNVTYELKEIQKMLNNYINNIKDEYTGLIRKILE